MLSFTSHRLDYRETCKMFQADGPMPKMKASRLCQIWRSLDWRNDTILAFSPSGLIMFDNTVSRHRSSHQQCRNAKGNAKGNVKLLTFSEVSPWSGNCAVGIHADRMRSTGNTGLVCLVCGASVLQTYIVFPMFLWAVVIRCQNFGCTFSWDIFGHPRRQLLSCSPVA